MSRRLLGSRTDTERPRFVTVKRIIKETPSIRTFTFDDRMCSLARPGQFSMVWVPGADEVPMSLSLPYRGANCSITVKEWGPATAVMFRMSAGDKFGIRGPYGTSFSIVRGEVVAVGGGTGMAPLMRLCQMLLDHGSRITLVIGAKTASELLFLERAKRLFRGSDSSVFATTDDGSYGFRGLATDMVKSVLEKKRIRMLYACGPEPMMKKAFLLANEFGVKCEMSLERPMKCGVGLCGSCCIGSYILCTEGPVLSRKQLQEVADEFGGLTRDKTGKLVPIQ